MRFTALDIEHNPHGSQMLRYLGVLLLTRGKRVNTGHWQALEDVPHTRTVELENVVLDYDIPTSVEELQRDLKPNLPWAEDHFIERVEPDHDNLNPGVQFRNWPWYAGGVEDHKAGGQFSHTYMERYWPKRAGDWSFSDEDGVRRQAFHPHLEGIRFKYGDLQDVVVLLAKHPHTRQAYLPVWFPEDTGAVHGERVPCSLGYHFVLRDGQLHCNYFIRSCDYFRYLRDDLYLTARLVQWVVKELQKKEGVYNNELDGDDAFQFTLWDTVAPGTLTMFISSLHVFEDELPRLQKEFGSEA